MRFSYAESMTDPSFYAPLARAAEEAGYDSMVVPDSICYPLHADQPVPVHSRRQPRVPGGQAVHRAVLAHTGARRGHQRIFVSSRSWSSCRCATRCWWPSRRRRRRCSPATGSCWGSGPARGARTTRCSACRGQDRGRRMDEELAIIRGLSAGGYFEYHGRGLRPPAGQDLPGADASPSPSSSAATATPRCAAPPGSGDGWLHGGGDPADLPGLLARLAESAPGRDGTPTGRSRCT